MMSTHERFMRMALAEARRGLGRTSPNPAVGAVLVQGERVVARGWHHQAGQPHAEIEALRAAADRAAGATLYVNLEPCCHAGKTGPCTEAVIASGVREVIVGMLDPNPRVHGKGVAALRQAGIRTVVGVLEKDSQRLNEPFAHFMTTGRPFVSLKTAASLDGKIATATGHSQWITSDSARAAVHRLRDRVDAIVVGVGTVIADDPQLTTRLGRRAGKTGLRVVLDTHLDTPPTARVLHPIKDTPRTLVCCSPEADRDRAQALAAVGAEILELPSSAQGLDLLALVNALAGRNVLHMLVEGGSRVATSFLRAGLVDKLHYFIAPKIIGGDGLSAFGGLSIGDVSLAPFLTETTFERLGPDLLLEGSIRNPPQQEATTGATVHRLPRALSRAPQTTKESL